jgi:hypothetical protein
VRQWCEKCGREVEMVSPREAEAVAGLTQPIADELLTDQPVLSGAEDSRNWHWSRAADGSTLVCLESLLRSRRDLEGR